MSRTMHPRPPKGPDAAERLRAREERRRSGAHGVHPDRRRRARTRAAAVTRAIKEG